MTDRDFYKRAKYYLSSEIKELNLRLTSPFIEPHKRRELENHLRRKYRLLAYYNKKLITNTK